ncbi:family 78 glycoside hydrolase catalytic domain [Bifidobacterium sp. UBA744]|uniref:family 78 glycoside hydrolase catalytic domain n=1 Tax=Bifidobacterium sp. UBA744 TaxID=1946112 RepID=UPI0025C6608B|nr:family 78 glycoside hydrolase catalytic domain [Bifidobacterium sp. UBA744]
MRKHPGDLVSHIRINERVEPVDLPSGEAITVRWWPVPNATAHRVLLLDRPHGGTTLWRSDPIGNGNEAVLPGIATTPASRHWLVIETTFPDGITTHSAPVTFGTAPSKLQDERITPIWASPATAAANKGEQGDPNAGTVPAFSGLRESDSDAGDEFFQRPTIRQTRHNGLGWAFMRHEFTLPDEPVLWATLHVTAASVKPGRQFVYRAWVNGKFVGLGPTFPTHDEARTDGFDVTNLLKPGRANAIGALAWTLEDRRFLARLDITLTSGRTLHIGTNHDWKAIVGNAAYPDSLSTGTQYCESPAEDLQTRHYPFGFAQPSFNDSAWAPAEEQPPFARLEPNPADKVTVVYNKPASVSRTPNGHVIIDFGRAWMGGIRLTLASPLDSDADIRIRYGEVLNPDGSVKYRLSAFNTYEETWHITPDAPAVETWGLKVFRYVELIGADDDASQAAVQAIADHPETVAASAIVYPFDKQTGSFQSSDTTLNRVWELCRNTIEAFSGPIYADSWTRERAAYEADAWLQWRSHLALDDAPSVGAYSIDYLIANRTWPTEWPLYLILAVHDAWMATGSLAQARREYDRLAGLLPDRHLDDRSGFIVKDPGDSSATDGDLVDWPPAERDGFTFGRVNTVINALASQAYADMADLAKALGRADDAARYAGVATRMRQAINDRLFDDFQGAYLDGIDSGPDGTLINHASEHASAFVLAFADVPRKRLPRLARFLGAKGMACSVYAAAILLEGLYRHGFGSLATKLIASHSHPRSWWNMLRAGAGGTSEGWDVSIKGNTTYSHPWASSPAYLLPQGMLGIRPIEPGYRCFEVRPQLDGVRHASATLPCPYGEIRADARLGEAGTTELELDVPAMTRATVRINGTAVTVQGPRHIVCDGSSQTSLLPENKG